MAANVLSSVHFYSRNEEGNTVSSALARSIPGETCSPVFKNSKGGGQKDDTPTCRCKEGCLKATQHNSLIAAETGCHKKSLITDNGPLPGDPVPESPTATRVIEGPHFLFTTQPLPPVPSPVECCDSCAGAYPSEPPPEQTFLWKADTT